MAPNFEVVDVNGESHELYEYLAADHYVVIYFMATWSETSWSYHNGAYNGTDGQGALIALHEEHGVENGGNVVVLMVEGDPSTNVYCLTADPACNFTTYGNWTQDTPFAVIESSEVADLFEISDFPAVMTICPNGSVTETGRLTAENHWSFIENYTCPEMVSSDAALSYGSGNTFNCEIEEIVVDLVNIGTDTLTSAHILSEGGSPTIDLQWAGSLATFESESINFGVIAPNPGEELIFYINGVDDNPVNDTISAGFLATTSSSHIHLELQSDTYPEDFSFFILDENDNVVVSDGNWGGLGADALIERDYFLPDLGCYQLWLVDSWGDGLFEGAYCHVYGIDDNGADMELILDVGFSEFSEVFGGANVNQIILGLDEIESVFTGIEVFPNPATETINISFELAKPGTTKMQLTSPKGDIVFSKTLGKLGTGQHTFKVDIPDVAAGFYLLSITSDGAMVSERVKLASN
jgi:hypothetical protein